MKYLSFVLLAGCLSCNNNRHEPIANDWLLVPFIKADSFNPVMTPDSTLLFNCPVRQAVVQWEAKDVFNPASVVRNDTFFLLYRAEDKIGKYAGTSRIGIAWSTDGLHFTKNPTPVLYPGIDSVARYEWEGGCEDPRIVVSSDGIYFLTYTAYDGDKARLMVASSLDLFHWTKHGHAFARAYNGKYINGWSKSGSIVSSYETGTPVAVKINGHYWMYWGDTNIFIAWSDDLLHWTPVEKENGTLLPVFTPRNGMFDSDLVEPGPPAILTTEGIVLIYNSRNVRSKGDSLLAEGAYTASQILFAKEDPSKVIGRMQDYFIKPDKSYEIEGQVNQVCFVEGLVRFRNDWYLYYGTADSKIAVAIKHAK